MSILDKKRWEKKYQNLEKIPTKPIELLKNSISLAPTKEALDIACGMGRHSIYLASLGFKVDAIDISSTAINHLKDKNNIFAKEVDLDGYKLKKEAYGLIICSYFVQRDILNQILDALKPNAVAIIETFIYHKDNQREPSNPSFLLQKGELETIFNSNILKIEEFWSIDYLGYKRKKVSCVVIKK